MKIGDDYKLTFKYDISERWRGTHKYMQVYNHATHLLHEYHLIIESEMFKRFSVKQLKSLIKKAQEELERRER